MAVLFSLKLQACFDHRSEFYKHLQPWHLPFSMLFTYELMQYFVNCCINTESETLRLIGCDTTQKLAYLIQNEASMGKMSHFHRDDNLVLNFLRQYYRLCGSIEHFKRLACTVMKIFVRIHLCQDLFEYMLVCLEEEDRMLGIWTETFFRPFSQQFPDFCVQQYIPKLLLIADSDKFIAERIESVQAGLNLLRIHQKLVDSKTLRHYIDVVMECANAGISSLKSSRS